MSYENMKQPDGRYAIYCHCSDGYVAWDLTDDELVETRLEILASKFESELIRMERELRIRIPKIEQMDADDVKRLTRQIAKEMKAAKKGVN